jgi:hypothetical protein
LGIAEGKIFATSPTDPGVILIGLYHDGSVQSLTPYSTNWAPLWQTVKGGDGAKPLVDINDANNLWVSGQGDWKQSTDHGNSYSLNGNYSNGVLSKTRPLVIFRNLGTTLYRSFDGGLTNQVINYQSAFPTFTVTKMGLFYTSEFRDDLVFNLASTVNPVSSTGTDYILVRARNASSTNTSNIIWEQLPLPRNGQFQGLDFDDLDPNIIYIAYSSVSTNTNSATGEKMMFRMNYGTPSVVPLYTCSVGTCTDLTLNLPNTGMGWYSFVKEKGSDDGLYFGTDIGIFYTNNQLINAGSNWSQLGANLPHTIPFGLEINYEINKIRALIYARGVWESDLACTLTNSLIITSLNSTSVTSKFKEVLGDIIITATIGAVSISSLTGRAGNEIHIQAGSSNDVVVGPVTRLFIHGCDHAGSSFRTPHHKSFDDQGNNFIVKPLIPIKTNNNLKPGTVSPDQQDAYESFKIGIFPNPCQGLLYCGVNTPAEMDAILISLEDVTGKRLFSRKFSFAPGVNETILDLNPFSNGIYLMRMSDVNGFIIRSEKVIVQRD